MKEPAVHTWGSLVVGQTTALERLITAADIQAFAELSGDYNPLHVHEGVVHGMLLGALVSTLVGMQLPGERALLVRESLSFKSPVHAGDAVVLRGTVVHKSESTHTLTIALVASVAEREVAEGEVLVRFRV